jgi:hypothetical protein
VCLGHPPPTRVQHGARVLETLECELLDRQRFPTQATTRIAVFGFIDGWYNLQRRHSALDCDSPIESESRHEIALGAAAPEDGSVGASQNHDLGSP